MTAELLILPHYLKVQRLWSCRGSEDGPSSGGGGWWWGFLGTGSPPLRSPLLLPPGCQPCHQPGGQDPEIFCRWLGPQLPTLPKFRFRICLKLLNSVLDPDLCCRARPPGPPCSPSCERHPTSGTPGLSARPQEAFQLPLSPRPCSSLTRAVPSPAFSQDTTSPERPSCHPAPRMHPIQSPPRPHREAGKLTGQGPGATHGAPRGREGAGPRRGSGAGLRPEVRTWAHAAT